MDPDQIQQVTTIITDESSLPKRKPLLARPLTILGSSFTEALEAERIIRGLTIERGLLELPLPHAICYAMESTHAKVAARCHSVCSVIDKLPFSCPQTRIKKKNNNNSNSKNRNNKKNNENDDDDYTNQRKETSTTITLFLGSSIDDELLTGDDDDEENNNNARTFLRVVNGDYVARIEPDEEIFKNYFLTHYSGMDENFMLGLTNRSSSSSNAVVVLDGGGAPQQCELLLSPHHDQDAGMNDEDHADNVF
jgi:hypothetical protein